MGYNGPERVVRMKTLFVAAALIFREQDPFRVLATARGYGKQKGKWEFPGGKLEEGETGEQAVRREIREELDAQIRVLDLLCRVEYDYPEFHLNMLCYLCALSEKEELKLLEAGDARWLSAKELYAVDWLPADLLVVRELEKYWSEAKKDE